MATTEARVTVQKRESDGTNIATELYAKYPLKLHICSRQNPTSAPSKAPTLFLLSHGGGLVSGDDISMQVHVQPNAALSVTSFSTTKAFKQKASYGNNCELHDFIQIKTTCRVERDALLALCPQPTQCFRGSRLKQHTAVTLNCDGSSSLLLVDWCTGGRLNLDGGLWQMDYFHNCTELFLEDDSGNTVPSHYVFRDATKLTGGEALRYHMRDFNITALVLLVGPRVEEEAEALMNEFCSRSNFVGDDEQKDRDGMNTDGLLISCGKFQLSNNATDGTLVRIAARSVEQAAAFLSRWIGTLRGQLEDDPFMEILQRRGGQHPATSLGAADAFETMESANEKPMTISKSFHKEEMQSELFSVSSFKAEESLGPGVFEDESIQAPLSISAKSLLLFQLADSSVPTGGFAHSNTVEAAHQLKLISPSTYPLLHHIWDVLLNCISSGIPFLLNSVHLIKKIAMDSNDVVNSEGAVLDDKRKSIIQQWMELDAKYDATITSHVMRRASSIQGSGMLRAYAVAFPSLAVWLKVLKRHLIKCTIVEGRERGHAATVFGAICGLLQLDDATVASMFIYTNARDMVSAAVRMNLVGPLEGGSLINQLCHAGSLVVDEVLSYRDGITFNDIAAHQVAPLVEIMANAHDRLYTRLFNS